MWKESGGIRNQSFSGFFSKIYANPKIKIFLSKSVGGISRIWFKKLGIVVVVERPILLFVVRISFSISWILMFYCGFLCRLIKSKDKGVQTNLGEISSKHKQNRCMKGKVPQLDFYSHNDRFLGMNVDGKFLSLVICVL